MDLKKCSHVLVCLLMLIASVVGQSLYESMYNQVYGPDSLLRGMRNVAGGVLAADKVHKNCAQKTICSEFSPEVVKMTEEVDPVKRTIVRVPKVIQREGRLRWIGDLVVNGAKKVIDTLGLNPYKHQQKQFRKRFGRYQTPFGGRPDTISKRQGLLGGLGTEATLAVQVASFIAKNWEKIPIQHIAKVMDLGMDMSGMMEKKGNVYPWVKSAGMGYAYGHRRDDDFEGVCSQMAPDCADWWDHLETVNGYDGGSMSRINAEERGSLSRAGEVDANDPLTWNHMKPGHIMRPRVFLCKSGLFLEKLNEKMGGDGVTKERFGPDEFQDTCDPSHLDRDISSAADTVAEAAAGGSGGGGDGGLGLEDIEIIDARDQETSTAPPLFGGDDWTDGFSELPILVFEGLPSPGVDQSEEELVESVLRLVSIPDTSVRTAVRLPLLSRGKSIVLVEMDTTKNRDEVIEHKDDLRLFRSPLVQVGIRRARYRELWKYVRGLTVAKQVLVEDGDKTEITSITDIIDENENEIPDGVEVEGEQESNQDSEDEDNDDENVGENETEPPPNESPWQENDEDETEILEALKKKEKNKNKASNSGRRNKLLKW